MTAMCLRTARGWCLPNLLPGTRHPTGRASSRVRPAGPLDSIECSDVMTVPLPAGIPHKRLWCPGWNIGTTGVWWETNETLLLDAVIKNQSDLVRCQMAGRGVCLPARSQLPQPEGMEP